MSNSYAKFFEDLEKQRFEICTQHRAKFGLKPDHDCEVDCETAICKHGCPFTQE